MRKNLLQLRLVGQGAIRQRWQASRSTIARPLSKFYANLCIVSGARESPPAGHSKLERLNLHSLRIAGQYVIERGHGLGLGIQRRRKVQRITRTEPRGRIQG